MTWKDQYRDVGSLSDATEGFDLTDAAEMAEIETTIHTQTERIARKQAERLDRELHGAWRAGYDYVHVYDKIGDELARTDRPDYTVSFKRAVLPTYEGGGRPSPSGYVYRFTYDLTSVPDHVIRAAIRDKEDADA